MWRKLRGGVEILRDKHGDVKDALVEKTLDGQLPIQSFLDQGVFHVTVLVAEYFDPTAQLPPHTILINAIGDADLCAEALNAATRIVAQTTARIVNRPQAVK